MWHEARRQEKQLRARIVDGSKRAERRRRYFDNVRRDPDQFMQIHGNKSVIYAERSIARAAEDANILRPWVGDKEILIDRFDARSHLDCIETPEGEPQLSSMEKKEELVCNYERYRLLVMNEFKDISEKAVLKNISEKEFWLNGQTEDQRKVELEKKKRKTGEKKATIGFSYGDSTTVAGRNEQESESEDEMQTEELGADLEVYLLNPESQKRCNKIGENFGVADQNFCALFKADQQAQRTASELKRIDRQKASLIGRDAKDDRKLLKQERAILIANARQDESIIVFPSERATEEKAVSESSSSSSDEESAKAEFILSFGKDDEEPLKKLSSRRRKNDRNRRRSRSRSRSRDRRRRSATGSRERYRRKRSYSRDTRSKSRERRRSRDRGKRSRDKKRSVRSRSRSTDRKRRRARTSSSRSQSPDRPIFKNNPIEKPKFQEVLAEKRESSDDNGPTNLLDIRSSMSESEKERIEIENRKRRVRKTKRMLKSKPGSRREHTSEKDNSEHVQAVKKKMQKALKATVEELKEEEEERKRETERERRVRDELIFIEQQERKMREQKKVEDLRRADLERAIEDARKRAEVQRRRRHSSDSDDGD